MEVIAATYQHAYYAKNADRVKAARRERYHANPRLEIDANANYRKRKAGKPATAVQVTPPIAQPTVKKDTPPPPSANDRLSRGIMANW